MCVLYFIILACCVLCHKLLRQVEDLAFKRTIGVFDSISAQAEDEVKYIHSSKGRDCPYSDSSINLPSFSEATTHSGVTSHRLVNAAASVFMVLQLGGVTFCYVALSVRRA